MARVSLSNVLLLPMDYNPGKMNLNLCLTSRQFFKHVRTSHQRPLRADLAQADTTAQVGDKP